MNDAVTPLYAPTAKVLQLEPQGIPATDELSFTRMSYGFTRRTRWSTILEFYADRRFEVMPQQLLKLQEFVIRREHWTQAEIEYLEAFVDAHKGAAYPFYFTAPDDGMTYSVRFREDQVEYSVPSAVARSGELVLVEAGDLENDTNNGLVYPDYVESTTTSSSTSTTSSATTATATTTDTTTDTTETP